MEKRLFLSIQLPEQTKIILYDYQKNINIRKIRWTKKENLHLTLYFLGNIKENLIQNLINSLDTWYKNTKPFILKFEKITLAPPNKPSPTYFARATKVKRLWPMNKNPKMIWVEFEKNQDYQHLFDITNQIAKNYLTNQINKTKEQIPHVTLARFKSPIDTNKIILKQPQIPDLQLNLCQLMESKLNSDGPIYSTLATFSFDGL